MPAPSAIGKTEIIDKALLLLGQVTRNTDYEGAGSEIARDMRAVWSIAVPTALARHPWNFAIARKVLLADTQAPEFGYAFRYRLPADCLRFLPAARGEPRHFEGEVESGYILTDTGPSIDIRYIHNNADLMHWSALFADFLAWQIALEYLESKGKGVGLRDRIEARMDTLLTDAKRADALENGNRRGSRVVATSRWAGARYTARGYGVR